MIISPLLRQYFVDHNGAPLAGGSLYSYQAGTTTPQGTYSDQAGTANTNPVVLDSYGYADVWLDVTKSYKFVLKDASGNTLWTVDNINGVASGGGILTYNTQGANQTIASGYSLIWPNLTVDTGLTMTVNSGGALFVPGILTVLGTLTVNGKSYVYP